MTPSKGDPDHAVNLSSVHGMCTFMCMCSAFVYIHACMHVYVCIHKQSGSPIQVLCKVT